MAASTYFRAHVFVCQNERAADHPRGCCKDKGAIGLRDYMKARCQALGLKDVRINAAGCLDRCELGPTLVIYPQAVWYRAGNRADIDRIVQEHLIDGEVVSDLSLRDDQ